MKQFRDILRGALATYLFGTFLFFVAELPMVLQGPSMFSLGETFMILAVYGAMFAFFATLLVLLLWVILAANQTTVAFPVAPFVAGVIFCGLGWLLAGSVGLVVGFALGAIAGVHFWYWAFGRVWDVQMRFKSEAS